MVMPDGQIIQARGEAHGELLREPVGNGGFGYDCVFESDDLKKSFGLATPQEKNAVSHRFRALQELRKVLL